MTTKQTNRPCTATCSDGSPCRAWAVYTSDPPRCAAHGGGSGPVGAPVGNQNARTHGFYTQLARCGTTNASAAQGEQSSPTIDTVIEDLYARQQSLSRYIDQHADDLSPRQIARLLHLHFQAASRLGRLLRDRQMLADAAEAAEAAETDEADDNDDWQPVLKEALAQLHEGWSNDS